MLTIAQLELIKNPIQRKLAKKFDLYNDYYDAEVDVNAEKGKDTSVKQERYYNVAAETFNELNKGTIKIIQQSIDTAGY